MRSCLVDVEVDHVEVLARAQERADNRELVTLGRAAQMLRMSRYGVWKYVAAGELGCERVEGPQRRRGGERVMQLVFTKGEVRRFRQRLEDRRRRRPTRREQLDLPLVSATRPRPQSWRWASFKPRMLKAGGATKVDDRQPGVVETLRVKRAIG